MSSPNRPVKTEKQLTKLDIGACYHCETRANSNTYCQLWDMWACKDCLQKHHRTDHETCKVEKEEKEEGASYFLLTLTRFDGAMQRILCHRGEEVEMEDHWMGTMIFTPAGMVLVKENRETINRLILEGLQSLGSS